MNVFVKVLKGTECKISVASGDVTVLDVKNILQSQVSIPTDQQKLIHQGKTLADENTLGHYKIKDGAKLFLMLKKPGSGKTPSTSTSTPASTPVATPGASTQKMVKEEPVTQIPDDPVGFWEKMNTFLKRHFTEKDAFKVLLELKKDLDNSLDKMSLDDIERFASNSLHFQTDYQFHEQMS